MDVEKIAATITGLIEEVYADGVKKGRDLEYEDAMHTVLTALQNRKLQQAEPAPTAIQAGVLAKTEEPSAPEPEPEPPPASASPPAPLNGPMLEISKRVETALVELADGHEDGVYPDAIADQTGLKPRDVRTALRSMVVMGHAHRKARGKFAPNIGLFRANRAIQNQSAAE